MRLTPIDVINKQFPSSLRGFQKSAVEDFLREVAADFSETAEENARLREKIDQLTREIDRFKAMETTLKEAIILAQKTSDDTRAAARREAEVIVQDARARANAMLTDAERSVEELRHQRARFERDFHALLRSNLDSLEAATNRAAIVSGANTPSERDTDLLATHVTPFSPEDHHEGVTAADNNGSS